MSNLLWDIVLKSLAIAAFGLGVTATMRRSSAATRHLVLTLTLLGLLALPLVDFALPRWQVPFVTVTVPASAPVATAPVAPAVESENYETNPSVPIGLLLWGSVGLLCAARIAMRLIRLRRMEHHLDMAGDPALQAIVSDQCRRSRRHVLLLEGAPNEPPMTWGHFRPVLLLPSDAGNWQMGRLQSVVLHELAHIERGDWLASVLSQVACAAYWFNPFVWAIAARMGRESESAADDRVLNQGLSGPQYATHLLEVLKDLRGAKPASDAALAMARPGTLDGRVRAILEERRCRRPARGMAALGLVATISGVVALVAAAGPTIIREAAQAVGPEARVENKPDPTSDPVAIVPATKKASTVKLRRAVEHVTASQKSTHHASTNRKVEAVASSGSSSGTGKAATVSVFSGEGAVELNGVDAEVKKGVSEAQTEVNRAMAEAQHEMDQAMKEGATKEQLQVAKDAMKLGMDAATKSIKSIQPIIKSALNEAMKNVPHPAPKPPKQKTKTGKS